MKDAATDDALPLLAFALRELYDRFGKTGVLNAEAYRALGDDKAGLSPLENAVRHKADELLGEAKPSAENLQALKQCFVPAMVRVNPEGEYVRRPARIDVLPAEARPLLERLAKERLLTLRREGEAVIIEVTHEALLRKWPLLRGWLDAEREFLIGKDQIEQDIREWNAAPEATKSEALLSGLKLTRARVWLVANPHQLSEMEQQYIRASIDHESRLTRKAFRQRVIAFTSLAVLALITAVGGPWGYAQFSKQRLIDREAARTDIRGEILAYAVVAGGTALDTATGRETSPYTTPLYDKLHQKNKSLIEALQDVHDEVIKLTYGYQRPFLSTSMNGHVYLWQQPQSRVRRAVVVSVDDVGSPWPRLIAPRHDADAIANVLLEAGFRAEEITRLHNIARSDIEKAAERICQTLEGRSVPNRSSDAESNPKLTTLSWNGGLKPILRVGLSPKLTRSGPPSNTLVIFYFSGHGFEVNGQNFLMPTIGNLPFKNARDAQLVGVRLESLRQMISDCAAASVFILDTHFPAIFNQSSAR